MELHQFYFCRTPPAKLKQAEAYLYANRPELFQAVPHWVRLKMDLLPILAMLCIFGSFAGCHGSRILLSPGDIKSHYRYFNAVGKELVKRKHEVFILLPSFNDTVPVAKDVDPQFRILTFRRARNWDFDRMLKKVMGTFQGASFKNMMKVMPYMSEFFFKPVGTLSLTRNFMRN